MPFGLHPEYLLILLAIVLIIFGPSKLPQLGGAIGKTMREFRKGSEEVSSEIKNAIDKQEQEKTTVAASSVSDSNGSK
ncbi:MAG: Sec-independent protein translocase subunit TatA/TatB [Candidatus Dormibacteraceae bacterium]